DVVARLPNGSGDTLEAQWLQAQVDLRVHQRTGMDEQHAHWCLRKWPLRSVYPAGEEPVGTARGDARTSDSGQRGSALLHQAPDGGQLGGRFQRFQLSDVLPDAADDATSFGLLKTEGIERLLALDRMLRHVCGKPMQAEPDVDLVMNPHRTAGHRCGRK